MIDRIDLHVEVSTVSALDLTIPPPAEGTAEVAARVAAAREAQRTRYADHNVRTNAEADGELLESVARPDEPGLALLSKAVDTLKLSARGYHRVLRVARTLADLESRESVARPQIAEALSYRRLQVAYQHSESRMKETARMSARGTRLKAKVAQAFAAPDSTYRPLDAATVIKRNTNKPTVAAMESDQQPEPRMRRIVEIARGMLAGRISFIEGSRAINEMVPVEFRDDPDIIAFIAVDSETDTLPLGDHQKLWQPEALEKLKPEIDRAEQWGVTPRPRLAAT